MVLTAGIQEASGQLLGPHLVQAGATAYYYKPIFIGSCGGSLSSVTISPAGAGTITFVSPFHIKIKYNCLSSAVINYNGCSFPVTIIPTTLVAGPISGPVQACKNATSTYSIPSVAGASGYEWNVPGQGLVLTSSPSVSVTWSVTGTVNLSVTPIHPGGCPGTGSSLSVFVQDLPSPTGLLSGPAIICGGSNATYSISPITNATGYDWEINAPGATITSPQPYGTSVNVNFSLYASSGTIKVTPKNNCGNGTPGQKNITVNTIPSPTQPVYGPTSVCQGATNVVYYTNPVTNANAYNWTVSGGGLITSGNGTTQINVNWPVSGSGTVSLTPTNTMCGNGNTESVSVTIHPTGFTAVTSASFDHSELSIPVSKTLFLNTCSGGAPCVNKVIDKAELNILLNTGTDYEYGKNAFDTEVEVEVIGWDNFSGSGNQILNYKEIIKIDQTAPEQLFNVDFTADHPQIHRFEIILHNYNPDPVVSGDVKLEVFYTEVFRYDVHSLNPLVTSVTTIPPAPGVNQRTFSWNACEEFPNYEFQLLRLYNNAQANTTNQTIIQADIDWNKALTIETQSSATSLTISVVEGTGYYVWRVRPIGNFFEGAIANDQNWGAWSTTPGFNQGNSIALNFGTAPSPNAYVFYYTQFDEDINFSYSRFFAEEGKIKEGMTYANQLLQVQQNQIHLESQDDILVSQTVMDFVGRPALTSLPVPVGNKISLGYEPLFMKHALSGNLYKAEYFDDTNYQNPEAVSDLTGDNFDYYSDNNPDLSIPNAEGYPFSRTLFYSNGVNQVKETGGPGDTHRIRNTGTARTQRTLYSGVADAELIRIFGDEAPASESVHKVINIDANNVASVSYISKEGNVLATCLSINGVNPLLDPLPSQSTASFTVADTLSGDLPYGPTGTQSVTTVAFVEPTSISLHYEITASTIEDICLDFCTTCDYKIEFLVQNVDDAANPPLVVEKLLPPDICSNPVQWDTVIYLTLNPGMYTISRRVTAANVDPATIGVSTMPQTYLQQHLDSLGTAYDTLFQDSLAWIYTYLDSAWIEQLYDSLGVDINVPNPDLVFNDSLVYVSIGCDSFLLPIIVCPTNPCPPASGDFVQYFLDRWLADYPTLDTDVDVNGRYDFFANKYTKQEFSDMIDSMLVRGYSCDSLWLCWEQIVQNYESLSSMAQSIPDYNFDMADEFLNCTGRKIVGYSNNDYGPDGYISLAFEYFQYTHVPNGPLTPCEDFACGTGGCSAFGGFTNASTSFTPEQWMDLYNCVTNYDPSITIDPNQTALANCDSCKVACEDRRPGFISSIIRMFHNDSLYVEGDISYLVMDTTWGQQFIIGNDPLPSSFVFDISWEEVECMANSLVEHCKGGCQLTVFTNPVTGTIDSVGTQAEIFAMAQSMTYAYEIELPDINGDCPPDFERILPLEAGTGMNFQNIIKEWDKVYGGIENDYLLDAKQTNDGGYILVGASESIVSFDKTDPPGAPGRFDYWIVKIDGLGVKEWDSDIATEGAPDWGLSVLQSPDGGYLVVGMSFSPASGEKSAPNRGGRDVWLVKLNGTGQVVWDKSYGGTASDYVYQIVPVSDGGYLVVGASKSPPNTLKTEPIIGGEFDGWILKIDGTGNRLWDRTLGTTDFDIFFSGLELPDHSIILVGASNGPPNPAKGKTDPPEGGTDVWLVKLDASGNLLDDKIIGGIEDDAATHIIQTSDNGFALAGITFSGPGGDKSSPHFGDSDLWIIKLDQSWNIVWENSFGSTLKEGIGDVFDELPILVKVVEINSFSYLLGSTSWHSGTSGLTTTKQDPGFGEVDYWTVHVSQNGQYLSDKAWGGAEIDYFSSLVPTIDGFLIGGSSNSKSSAIKTETNRNNKEKFDYWIIKLQTETETDTCDHRDICFRWVPFPNIDSLVHVFEPWTCDEITAEALRTTLEHFTYEYKEDQLEAFEQAYLNTCANPDSIQDKFWLEYDLGYHHYTLYYNDRAGNLIKTVPPNGVDLLDVTQANVLQRQVQNEHTFITDYEYNSLKQLVRQNTPDGNESKFYYNRIGQLRFSQNEKQLVDGTYSYTRYDALGRIIEVGQSTQDVANIPIHVDDPTFPLTNNTQRTWTLYSISAGLTYLDDGVSLQRYLQNRVSYSLFDEDGDLSSPDDRVITSYSYDPHGNVEWLAQDIPGLGRQFVAYTYDLVSGNVLQVSYNEGKKDQFFHRYSYDADNRITLAETSIDDKIWDKDGSYEYYKHGPLRRATLGEDKLQGIDYTYTLFGWLKAVNHASLNVGQDPGTDNQTNRFAPDAFGMQLNYFTGDFNRNGSPFAANAPDALNPLTNHDLYNGNISTWASNTIPNPAGQALQYEQLTGNQYRYDELNRIKKADFKFFAGGWTPTDDYNTRYDYDANGNLLSLIRNGYASSHLAMDSLTYDYTPLTNKLNYVTDPVDVNNYTEDIDDQNPGNYDYDQIGQLIHDEKEEIDQIEWTVYGKVKSITRLPGSTLPALRFMYDANGNRIKKEVIRDATDPSVNTSTFYVRDASGNVMSIYEQNNTLSTAGYIASIYLSEQPLYGSDRLGERRDSIPIKSTLYPNGGGSPVDLALNVGKVTEHRSLMLPYEDVITIPFGPWSFTIPIGGKIDLDVSTGTATPGTLAPFWIINQGTHISRAEDENGNLLFSSFTPESGQGADIGYVFDANDQLMPGASGIISNATGNSVSMQAPGITDQHYLFTVGNNGRLYYHIIDLSLPGNGTLSNPLGEVVSINNPVNNVTSYGRTMALLDDHSGSANSQLYLRKYLGNNTASLVRFEITVAGISAEQVMTTYGSIANDDFEMQISPDGTQLAVTGRYRVGSGFFSFTKGRILTYDLSADHTTVTLVNADDLGLFAWATSLDFSPNGSHLVYSKNSGISSAANGLFRHNYITGQVQKITSQKGKIRRGYNDKMYLALPNAQDVLEIQNPDGAYSISNLNVNPFSFGKTTGGIQLQEHRIYDEEVKIHHYTRTLDKKWYELKDHLGNVRVTLGDIKLSTLDVGNSPILSSFEVDVKSIGRYYAFGMGMVGRGFSGEVYRYGFSGFEKDDNVKGSGNNYFTFNRAYDPRLGRWWSVDKLQSKTAAWTPYRAFFNNPNFWIDTDGNIEIPLKGKKAVNSHKLEWDPNFSFTRRGKTYQGAYKDLGSAKFDLSDGTTILRTSEYRKIRTTGSNPHVGVDYRAAVGTEFYSLGDGTVTDVGTWSGGITYVTVEYSNGDKISFLHYKNLANDIKKGATVKEGQLLGYTGKEGASSAHLHIQGVDKEGLEIDPEAVNYGTKTNAEFFYGEQAPENTPSSGGLLYTYDTTPDWARDSYIGGLLYFIFTGKDATLPDQVQPGYSDENRNLNE